MSEAIESFCADLQLAGRQPLTIEEHTHELRRFQRWLHAAGVAWYQTDRQLVRQYVRTKADLGFSSRANAFSTLRVFFAWCVEEQIMASSPAAWLKTPTRPKPVPRALSSDQLRRLLAWLSDQAAGGLRQKRDRVLILTGLYAGLRSAELAALRWPDIDQAAGVITIRLSKMNHGRSIPEHPVLAGELASWRVDQAGGDDWPVFSLDGQPLAAARPGKIVKRISGQSGIKFTTHQLRHSFATWMLRRSGNLYAVSKALGHSQVQQTEIYLSAAIDDLRVAVDTLPDLASW